MRLPSQTRWRSAQRAAASCSTNGIVNRTQLVATISTLLSLCILLVSRDSVHWHRQSSLSVLRSSAGSPYVSLEHMDRCDVATYPEAHLSSLTALDISNCNLTAIPEYSSRVWFNMRQMRKLDLNGNRLHDFPPQLSSLSSLEILFVSENTFSTIPSVIGELGNLRVLSLRGNAITELNAQGLPSSLVWLILTNNRIGKVPPSVRKLVNLQKLMLSHNALTMVPPDLEGCVSLQMLRIANNDISTPIPYGVTALPHLAWIALSGNPIVVKKVASIAKNQSSKKAVNAQDVIIDKGVEPLGRGASGTVYRGTYQGKHVAVKFFRPFSRGSDGTAESEIAINSLIDHPLAVSALGIFRSVSSTIEEANIHVTDETGTGMIMALIDGSHPLGVVPSFDTVTRDAGPFGTKLSKEEVYGVIWNVASVLEYIHGSLGVCHGDIYLHNVLRDGNTGVARLSDWGASFAYDRKEQAWLEKTEVLSFGHLVEDLFQWHRGILFHEKSDADARDDPQGNVLENPALEELLRSMQQADPALRPTFQEVIASLSSMPDFFPNLEKM